MGACFVFGIFLFIFFIAMKNVRAKIPDSLCDALFLSPALIFKFQSQSKYQLFGQSHAPVSHLSPDQSASPFTAWLTEIPEIQADGSSLWLMMSQADPFLCPLRSHSNPPQFPYVLHDKSHHAFQLTLLGPLIHFCLSPPEPGFGQTGDGFGRVNRQLRGTK